MDKSKRLLLFGIYVILCMIAEAIILWLFPYTGLGGLICWPLTILIAMGLGLIIFKVTKRQLKIWQLSTLFLCVFSFQIFLQLMTTPQDFGGTTLYKIRDTFNAYVKYDSINYSDFANLTTGERVAYIYKFKEELPDKFIALQIDSTGQNYESLNPRTHLFEFKKGKIQYDSRQLKLINNNTSTTIIEYLPNSDTIIHKTVRDIFSPQLMGWSENGYNFFRKEDDFEMTTGIEKLLYGILERTRKPNR
tara:strand:- start:6647 stop:7390 length:744 start_codon:yes stop_codon:yes gene_type:complete